MRHLTLLVFAAINAAFAAEPPQTIPLYPDRTTWSTRDDEVGCRMGLKSRVRHGRTCDHGVARAGHASDD